MLHSLHTHTFTRALHFVGAMERRLRRQRWFRAQHKLTTRMICGCRDSANIITIIITFIVAYNVMLDSNTLLHT